MEVQVIGSPGLDSHLDFPGSSDGEECTCNAGDLGSFPGLGRSLGGGHSNPLQYSCLKYPHGQRSLIGYSPWGCRVGHNCATTAQQRTAIQVETPLTLPPSVFMGARGLLHLQTSTPYPRWKVIAKVTFASQTCHFSIWKIICCKESPFGWLHLKSYCSESCHTIILRSKETSGIKNFNKTHCEPEYNHVSC